MRVASQDNMKRIDSMDLKHNIINRELVKGILPIRKRNTHKGTYGRADVIAGSLGMSGAAVLTCKAALRSGTGLVRLYIGKSLNIQVKASFPELITVPLEEIRSGVIAINNINKIIEKSKESNVIAIGPGCGDTPELREIVKKIIQEAKTPIVLDADALNALSRDLECLKSKKASIIVTPHPGEMARLTKLSIEEINKNKINIARKFAMKWGVITILKGADTIISSPQGEVFVNTTGNPGMATAGSGDVLTGLITSFIAQGIKPLEATISAVYIHGFSGDIGSKDKGEYGLIAGDIVEKIPYAIKEILGK